MTIKVVGTALALLWAAARVSAHGHPSYIAIDGKSYKGWDLGLGGGDELTVGWQGVPDDGPVTTDKYQSDDIICHNGATPAPGHAVVEAGGSIFIQYDVDQDALGQEWPVEHKGPIKDMLAPCPDGGCESVDKTTLEFFTIAAAGLLGYDSNTYDGGHWPTDTLRAQGNGWRVVVPPTIAPGFYVLRHEIIALHNAPNTDGGAQNYPFCFNLEITGSGTDRPQGAKPTTFYKKSDPGIDVSIWSPLDGYEIPGPPVIDGVEPVVQSVMEVTGVGEILTAGAGYSAPAATPAPGTDDVGEGVENVGNVATTATATATAGGPEVTQGPSVVDDDGEGARVTVVVTVTMTTTTTMVGAAAAPTAAYQNAAESPVVTAAAECDKGRPKERRRHARHMKW